VGYDDRTGTYATRRVYLILLAPLYMLTAQHLLQAGIRHDCHFDVLAFGSMYARQWIKLITGWTLLTYHDARDRSIVRRAVCGCPDIERLSTSLHLSRPPLVTYPHQLLLVHHVGTLF
jgi:hypothetical protein